MDHGSAESALEGLSERRPHHRVLKEKETPAALRKPHAAAIDDAATLGLKALDLREDAFSEQGRTRARMVAWRDDANRALLGVEGVLQRLAAQHSLDEDWVDGFFPASPTGSALVTPTLLSVTMQYTYGHLAAYEGEDASTDAFLPEKAQAAKDVLEGGCWRDITGDNGPQTSLGASKGAELYLPEYVDEVGNCGLQNICDTDLAKRWKERWVADRPPPVTDVPIVLWQGAKDDFIKPSYQQCGIDRLEGQSADLTKCVDPEGDHSSLIPNSAAWVRAYLAEKLLGEPAPEACPGFDTISPDLKCGAPIPNSVDPSEP